jgi:diadenosine tetraphosphate (Ap4A) HIT family hydrolase
MTDTFALDPRLDADTVPALSLKLSDVLLMNDARFPWLILVPRRPGLREIIDLKPADRQQLMDEIGLVSEALKAAASRCDKLNVAAIGNAVAQLHIHVIARTTADPVWPRPVWGVGEPVAYRLEERHRLLARIKAAVPT